MATFVYKLAVDKPDQEAAFEVRRQVFVEEQGISRQLEFPGLDHEAIHVVDMDAGRVIGAARVRFLDDSQAKIERMAILKPFRRKGIGTGMVSFLLGDLRKRQVKHVVLHAQHDAVPFYRSCGFGEVGEPFWGGRHRAPGNSDAVVMILRTESIDKVDILKEES